MTPELNLVPKSCRLAARRAARLRGWIAVLLLAGLGVLMLHLHGQNRRWQLDELDGRLRKVSLERQELQRELNLIARKRRELTERARGLLALNQGWPVLRQCVRLYQILPDGIALSRITAHRQFDPPDRPAARRTPARRKPPGVSPGPKQQTKAPQLRFELHGYARSFADLSGLIHALEQMQGCTHVSLLRATREQLESGRLVGFQIEVRIDPHRGEQATGVDRVARGPEARP